MNFYLYLDKDTPVHRLNPIVKILLTFLLLTATLLVSSVSLLAFQFACMLLLLMLCHGTENLRKVSLIMIVLFLVTIFLWSFIFSSPGSKVAFFYGLAMALRLNTMILVGVVMLSTTRLEEFTWALNRLGLKYEISFALSLAFRLLPLLFSTACGVTEAQRARALASRKKRLFNLLDFIPLMMPIVLYAFRNADYLAMALECRGFGLSKKRSSYLRPAFRPRDLVAVVIVAGFWSFFLWGKTRRFIQ